MNALSVVTLFLLVAVFAFLVSFCLFSFSLLSRICYHWTSRYIYINYLCVLSLQRWMCRFTSISLSVADRKSDVYTE